MRKISFIALCAMTLILCATVCRADGVPSSLDGVTFSLVAADLAGNPGDTLTWEYDVTNNSGGTIYADAINSGLFSNGTPDGSVFDYFNFFTGIADGTSLVGPLWNFTADPTPPSSFNSGQFDLTILLPDSSTIDLFADYSATISTPASIPEPGVITLFFAGLAFLLFATLPWIRS